MIITFILFLMTYAVGYLAGYFCSKSQSEKAVATIIEKTRTIFPDGRLEPGIIRRPTAKELHEKDIPKSVKEGREAMKQTLDNIPELQEHKRLLKKIKEIQP